MRPLSVIVEQPALAEGRLLHIGREVTRRCAPPRPASPGVDHPRLLPDRALVLDKDLGMIPGEHLIDCLRVACASAFSMRNPAPFRNESANLWQRRRKCPAGVTLLLCVSNSFPLNPNCFHLDFGVPTPP